MTTDQSTFPTTDTTTDTSTDSSTGPSTGSSTSERAQQTASTAAGEARKVTGEAAQHVRGLADQARGEVGQQLDAQTRTQRDRLVETFGSLGDDLHQMADQADTGLAGDLTREVAGRIRSVTDHLDGREPAELLDDVRRFARDRPGTFLLGALAAGVVVGRLARGTRDGAVAAAAAPQPTTPTTPTTPAVSTPVMTSPSDVGSHPGLTP